MTHRASTFGRGYRDHHLDPSRVRFRRALTLCVLTIFAPGSAQLIVGNKWVGRVALTLWILFVGGCLFLVYMVGAHRERALELATDPTMLILARAGLLLAAVCWMGLFIDAWRLGAPFKLGAFRATFVTGVSLVAIAAVVGSTAYASQLVHIQRSVVTTVFNAKKTSSPLEGRYNILLMGSDSGKGRAGFRPDSMNIASIDAKTGKTVLIALPRNLENVPFPEDSPMHSVYPDGFNCGSECLLNAVHTYAADRQDLYPGSSDPGLNAQIDAIRGVTGLKINYHIIINMKGFRSLVDAVGGVTMDVETRIAMFGHDDPWVNKYIEPGVQKLDGNKALWYARSRVQSDDYTRMGRQKCLMSAMLAQLSPTKVLLNAQKIADSSKQLLSTTIPAKELGQFADLALRSGDEKIATVSIVPPEIYPANPDFDKIKSMIADAIEQSEHPTKATASPSPSKDQDSTQNPDEDGAKASNQTDDLASTC